MNKSKKEIIITNDYQDDYEGEQIMFYNSKQQIEEFVTIIQSKQEKNNISLKQNDDLLKSSEINLSKQQQPMITKNYSNNSDHENIKIKREKFILKKQGSYTAKYTDVIDQSSNQKQLLGSGGFGDVQLIKDKKTNELRAVKKIKKSQFDTATNFQNLQKEIEILKKINHHNILQIFEYYDDSEFLYIITEYCQGGNLFEQIILQQKKFDEIIICKIMKQLLTAVKIAHEQQIIHRDIKPENILIEYDNGDENRPHVKLIDWGLSYFQDEAFHINQKQNQILSICGTLHYMAPEIFTQSYDEKVDIWSCGVVLYVLLSGTPPFEGKPSQILKKIKQGNFQFNPKYECWKQISDQAKDLIKKMLRKNSDKRPSAGEALEHPWFEMICTQSQTNIIPSQELQQSFNRLKNYQAKNKFVQAIMYYIGMQMTSKDENIKLRQIFQSFDKNDDGKLSQQEVIDGYTKIFGKNEDGVQQIKQIMQQLDIDKNGYIDYNEFITGHIDRKKLLNEINLRQAFDLFDQNGDGQITQQEIKNVLQQETDLDDNIWEDIVQEIDLDNDGEISFEEFKNIIQKYAKDVEHSISQSQENYQ